MADSADEAFELSEAEVSDAVSKSRKKVNEMPIGNPGECFFCERYFTRLVNDVCARCRDEQGLP